MPFLTRSVKIDCFNISLKINPVHAYYGYKFTVHNYFYIMLNLLANILLGIFVYLLEILAYNFLFLYYLYPDLISETLKMT